MLTEVGEPVEVEDPVGEIVEESNPQTKVISSYSLTESELRRRCNTVEKVTLSALKNGEDKDVVGKGKGKERVDVDVNVEKSVNNIDAKIDPKKIDESSSENTIGQGVFDCNICFDTVHEPVISLCGHLYCWPCIFRWIQRVPQPLCPVCKAGIGEDKLIPVYARGREPKDPRKNKNFDDEQADDGIRQEGGRPSTSSRPSAQRPQPDSFNPHYTGHDGFAFGASNGISIGFGLFPGLFFSFGAGSPFSNARRRSQMTETERRAADLGKFMLVISGLIFLISIWLES